MLISLILFAYIATVVLGIGLLFFSKSTDKKHGLIVYLTAGTVILTVYAQYFSLFAKVGAICHIAALLASAAGYYINRKDVVPELFKRLRKDISAYEIVFYAGFIIFIAFFTSRGTFHTDTNIYHGAAIRMYEDYKVIKGLGNLQLHYAYNSASLSFAALFSMKWLLGRSYHVTTGFYEVLLALYSFYGLKRWKEHKYHVADMLRVGSLFYILVIITGSMSPATDYSTMLMTMLLIALWCDSAENGAKEDSFALLSVMAVYLASMKFSSCMLVIMAIYPAVILVKNKRFKAIAGYLLLGIAVILPFLIRNYILSGWLLYPFEGIDIFDPVWKIPKEYLFVDAAQIKVWGRCLYDVSLIDMPMAEWIPIWWSEQERYAQMLVYGTVAGGLLLFILIIERIIRRAKTPREAYPLGVLYLGILANLAVWFVEAPFIRYGLAFILASIMISVGIFLSGKHRGLLYIAEGLSVFLIIAGLSPYFDNYFTDAGVFLKQNLKEPYYINQKDYDRTDIETLDLNGITVYAPLVDEINSYYDSPGSCYKFMVDRTEAIGDTIEEGFKAK